MRKGLLFALCELALVLVPAGLCAQEQVGSLQGRLASPAGEAVARGMVEVVGPAGRVSTLTDPVGEFRLPPLPAGDYVLWVTCASTGQASSYPVRVDLGKTARMEVLACPAVTEASVTIVARDSRRIARTVSLRDDEIAALPHHTDFSTLPGTLPGIAFEPEAGGISVDGASGSENRFIIDGIDTTHPMTGISGKPLVADFVGELQVKSAGYEAEHGGATGGVINVITRSGTDQLNAGAGVRVSSAQHDGEPRPVLEPSPDRLSFRYRRFRRDDELRTEPWATAAGPLATDHAWFFIGYEQIARDTDRTVDFIAEGRERFAQEQNTHFLTANLSGNAHSRLLWRLATNLSPGEVERSLPDPAGTGSANPADYRFGSRHDNAAYSFNADWVASDEWLLAARGGYFVFDTRTTNGRLVPYETVFGDSPALFPEVPADLLRPPGFSTAPRYTLTRFDRFERTAFSADAVHLLNAAGHHELKAGLQAERVENQVLRTGNASLHFFAWDRRDPFFGERGRYGYLQLENPATAGEVRSDNVALFLQDTWAVRPDLTIHLGLRAEEETVPDFRLGHEGEAAIRFRFEDKLAPRLGFSWNPRGSDEWRAYGSWGTYFDVTKYQLARTSFGAERRVLYYYRLDDYDWTRVQCVVIDNDPEQVPNCGLPLIGSVNLRLPSNESIDPAIRPMESREWQLGLDRQLAAWTLGLRYLHKELVRTIEDIGAFDAARRAEIFTIGNPGEGSSRWALPGLALPEPVREYDALELTAAHRHSGPWSVSASYTYSRLWGNYPGLASSDEDGRNRPNILRIYDSWFGLFDECGRPVYGRLGTDRPHQLEAQLLYRGPGGTTLGLYQYAASGTPRTSTAWRQGIPFYPYGRGDMGRNPTLTQTDLRIAKDWRLRNATFEAALTVLNLFDEDTTTDVRENLHLGDVRLTDEQFRAGFDLDSLIAAQDLLLDPAYGQPVAFQAPRVAWVGLAVRF